MAAFEFINYMTVSICSTLNQYSIGNDFCEESDPIALIIKQNILNSNNDFSVNKFERFILDESKSIAVKLVLIELEEHGLDLLHCWGNACVIDTELNTRKERVISHLIMTGDISTFKELFEAFEPNGLKLD